mmetsp:Transcript_51632/g.85636  ORF Transcript_51632/g.85636 Transcript_51632/m.85636 type:complete len:542 (-) Transcript_51632:592-2217(-)
MVKDAPLLEETTTTVTAYGATRAVLLACVAGIGPLIFGYTLGFTSPAQLSMEVSHSGNVWKDTSLGSDGQIQSAQAAIFGSLVNLGAIIGAVLAGPIANGAGRRLAIACSAMPWAAAFLWMFFAHGFLELFISRILSGIAVGIASMCVPLFISETAPTSIRGALGAINQLAVTLGIFLVYLMGDILEQKQTTTLKCGATGELDQCCLANQCSKIVGFECNTSEWCEASLIDWRSLAVIGAGLSAALLVAVLTVLPETPTHLMNIGKPIEATRVLRRLRNSEEEVISELRSLEAACMTCTSSTSEATEGDGGVLSGFVADETGSGQPQMPHKQGGMRGLFKRGARTQFGIGCMMMLVQQLSGINAVIFYSSDILLQGGIQNANAGGLLVMGVQVGATAVSVLLMERAGRRLLLLVSTCGMAVAAAALAYFFLNHHQPAWLALASLILYIISFSLGLGPIPWLVMGELFPAHIRATAASVATMLNWSLSFLVTLTFEKIAESLTPPGVFFLFSGICASGFAFVALCVPETRGKSFEEVEALFR